MKTKETGEWTSIPVNNYLIETQKIRRKTWNHCDGCDICEEDITRFQVLWKESLVTRFEINSENEWPVIHALEKTLRGL